jgi:hypothetical protein
MISGLAAMPTTRLPAEIRSAASSFPTELLSRALLSPLRAKIAQCFAVSSLK